MFRIVFYFSDLRFNSCLQTWDMFASLLVVTYWLFFCSLLRHLHKNLYGYVLLLLHSFVVP